ncbi:putative MFS transporter [Aspergillus avenaceus]|uniref:Putative MFS transporter n=1 Tax=Aspergillus avenaceus TaxID=36643 RepID=A0A5N6U867_ASPAV|nr:putative MFS transporter [Aspergillus avenaceus]
MPLWPAHVPTNHEPSSHPLNIFSIMFDDVLYDIHSDNDVGATDAHNWSMKMRWLVTVIVCSIAGLVSFAAAVDSAAISQIASEFHVSEEAESLATAMYLFGYGVGSMVSGPFSETLGRSLVYIISLLMFMISTAATGASNGLATQSVFRFFAGFFGASPMVCVGGSFSDFWTARQLNYVFPIFAISTFVGSALGPCVGAFLAEASPSWRWVDWITVIMAGAMLIVVVVFLPETFRPLLLKLKAREIQRYIRSGKHHDIPFQQVQKASFARQILETIYRPFVLIIREPIVILVALYLTIIFVILFTSLNGYAFIFGKTYGFTQSQTGLCFLAMLLGNCLVIPLVPVTYNLYCRDLRHFRYSDDYSDTSSTEDITMPPPENQLYSAMFGAPFIPLSLFSMAFTTSPDITPWAPILSSVPFGFGFTTVFISCYQYVMDSYGIWSASALASVNLARCLVTGVMMMVTIPLYTNLGVRWSLMLVGVLSTAMVPVPYAFYKWGYVLRRKSRNALG